MKCFSIIAAISDSTSGIGLNGKIPWNINGDMTFFKNITSESCENKSNAVIMGRKTWESLPKKYRPLPNRINIVISRDTFAKEKYDIPDSVILTKSLNSALKTLSHDIDIDKIFVIGGESLYREAIESHLCNKLYITEVFYDDLIFDTFFPIIPKCFQLNEMSDINVENSIKYRFTRYDKRHLGV
jgi:dihydrofolate reductase